MYHTTILIMEPKFRFWALMANFHLFDPLKYTHTKKTKTNVIKFVKNKIKGIKFNTIGLNSEQSMRKIHPFFLIPKKGINFILSLVLFHF
jgi:hypothetical protein